MHSVHRALTLAGLAGLLSVPVGCGSDAAGDSNGAGATAGAAGSGGVGGSAGAAGSGGAGAGGGVGGSAGAASGGSAGSAGSAGVGGSAGSAGVGGSAGSAGVGGSAGSAGVGGSGGAGGSAGSAGAGGSAGTAGSGGAGGSAGSAGAGGSAGTAGSGGAGGSAGAGGSGGAGGADSCASVDCGDHGACVAGSCVCDAEWIGASCDACAPGYRPGVVPIGTPSPCVLDEPATTNMKLWLDATQGSTFDFDSQGKVLRWRSRVAGDALAFTDGGTSSARPSRPLAIGGNAWVTFDGVDDRLRRNVDLGGSTYSIYLVVRAASGGPSIQTPLSAVQPGTLDYGLLLQTRDSSTSVYFRHTFPFGSTTNDTVSIPAFPTTSATLLEFHRNLSGYQYWDGDSANLVSGANASPFGEVLQMELGRRADSGTFPFKGSIGELIVLSPAPAVQNRAPIREYLQAKWR